MVYERLSLKYRAVKASTLTFAPRGWFSVRDYLSRNAEDVDIKFVGEGRVLEIVEDKLPSEKTLAMRLLRYHRQRLLDRRREGHKFLYKVTEKGRRRGLFLKRHYTSIYEIVPHLHAKKPRRRTSTLKTDFINVRETLPILRTPPTGEDRRKTITDVLERIGGGTLLCPYCTQPISGRGEQICPHCRRSVDL